MAEGYQHVRLQTGQPGLGTYGAPGSKNAYPDNLALDLTSPAFGIQEGHVYPEAVHEIFGGTPVIRAGYATPSESPGWGIELDEKAAESFPPVFGRHERWTARVRRPDGAVEAP